MAKIAGTESTANTMSDGSRHEERDQQRRGLEPAGHADEEGLAVQVGAHGQHAPDQPDQRVAGRIGAAGRGEQHLHPEISRMTPKATTTAW